MPPHEEPFRDGRILDGPSFCNIVSLKYVGLMCANTARGLLSRAETIHRAIQVT